MHLLLLCMLVLLPLRKASWRLDGRQNGHRNQSALSVVLLERSRRELPVASHEEAEDKPDLFVAVPHLVGTNLAGEDRKQREKMLTRFARFWKKPERELHPPGDLESEHFPLTTQALPQPVNGMKVEKSPLWEEAKKFWHHFMFRKGPASQGVVLPIKSHEVHRETCRTVPFSQVCIPGRAGLRVCESRTAGTGAEEGRRCWEPKSHLPPDLVLRHSSQDLAKHEHIP